MAQRLILISGGIGSGKSAVGAALRARGVVVIDADAIGHALLEPGGAASGEVSLRWPAVVVDGKIDRRELGRVVFGDSGELVALEAITHPMIAAEIGRQVKAHGGVPVALEYPLLGDSFGPEWIRIVVDAPDDVRVARLLERGMTEDEISGRMAAQPSRGAWLAAADHVIDNSGDLEALDEEVRAALHSILSGS